MAISIEYKYFWHEQEDLKLQCIKYIESNLSFNDFSLWDELSDFSDELEIDVFVYDHLTHNVKDYLYGEDWGETNSGRNMIYLNSI